MPELADHGVDDVEDGLRRTEARRDRQVAELAGALDVGEEVVSARVQRLGPLSERLAGLVEALRIGSLEAVDRLLEVADHEQGAAALLGLGRAAEELLDQPLDDLPLGGVGVLRLVDQHVIDLAVELVAHPFAHSGLAEQAASPFDEVVEVGDPGAALGPGVGLGELPPGAKARGHFGGEQGAVLDAQQLGDQHRETPGVRFIMRFGLRLTRGDPRSPLFGENHLAQVGQSRRALDRRQREPLVDDLGIAEAGLGAPFAVGLGDRAQQVAVEPLVAAIGRDMLLDRSFGQAHRLADHRSDRLGRAERSQCVLPARTGPEIFDRAHFAEAAAENLHVANQIFVAPGFGIGQQFRERAPHQLLLGAALDRLEAGRDAGFGRERPEQRLGEAVDRLDLQAPGAIEDLREQLAREFERIGIVAHAERE